MKGINTLLLFVFVIATAGKCNEDITETTETTEEATEIVCDTQGTVVDKTGLDGCGIMIDLEDGRTVEPIWGDFAVPAAGSKISLAYEPAEDMASICMSGEIVNITCLEVLETPCKPFVYGTDLGTMETQDFTLMSHRFEGNKLYLKIGVSGCDLNRNFQLNISKAQMKSMPPQNAAILSFTPQMCEAYFTTELCFDLTELGSETVLNLKVGEEVEKIHFKP
ncbi:hypothetical protein GYB22_09515 [bacterium]|nr:hypothetical protein [bacterium]